MATLERTVSAILRSERCWKVATVDILVNGNAALARDISRYRGPVPDCVTLRVWKFSQPDKANTWNRYLHELVPDCDVSFFVDGYAELDTGAICSMLANFHRHPDVLAMSGIQRMGPSARSLLRRQLSSGGLCGNLYAIPAATIEQLRSRKFRMPLGIYRNDATLGAALCFNLDPQQHNWDRERLLTVPEASFSYRVPRPWRINDLVSLARRRFRQARGVLENRAVRDHFLIRKRPPSELPTTADELVLAWCKRNRAESRRLFLSSPIVWLAYRQFIRKGPPALSVDPPTLLATIGNSGVGARTI